MSFELSTSRIVLVRLIRFLVDDLDSESDWEKLMEWGVDRLNADDLANTARLVRI